MFIHKGLAVLAVITAAALIPAIHAVASWGPNRPTFTWANPATYVTFNSITDNPVFGDERTFFDGTYVSAPGAAQDRLTVSDNQELSLRVFFHNNARADLNLVATNTKVKILLPTQANTNTTAAAYISADNANPLVVADSLDFTGAQPFTLEYETGTAQLWNNVFRGISLNDSIVSSNGALVGYNAIDGRVPGCEQFSGYVTVKVRVHMQPTVTPAAKCDLLKLDVSSGRKVDANVTYTATGGASLKSVTFDWGDSTPALVTSSTSANHTYAKDGNYTVKSITTFNVGGSDQSTFCTAQVSFNTPTTPTPQVGKSLPNTGAGSTLGIFAGVSALAGAGHYIVSRRVRG